MDGQIRIGFIGFGEAGFHIALGLRGAGVSGICAYDINSRAPGLGEKIHRRAAESDVSLLESNAELAAASDILLSTVTANRAAEAAEQTAPFLSSRHIYADLNSVSPALKQTIGQMIESCGARFVEVAIMSPVPRHGAATPMFLGGAHAREFAGLLSPYGMKLEVISERIGAASAVKMCRSVVVKGLESLMLECVLGAVPYGADERVFATLDESFPGIDWKKLASYIIGRVVEHGERRAREMEEVAATLRSIGVEPIMAEATARRQDWLAGFGLLEHFDGKAPDDYRAIAQAVADMAPKYSFSPPQSGV
jgi:3-hydroxyisobutyrate dehydrogenase-like beta-hydroxyacid dehydrogenase